MGDIFVWGYFGPGILVSGILLRGIFRPGDIMVGDISSGILCPPHRLSSFSNSERSLILSSSMACKNLYSSLPCHRKHFDMFNFAQ